MHRFRAVLIYTEKLSRNMNLFALETRVYSPNTFFIIINYIESVGETHFVVKTITYSKKKKKDF